MEEKSGIILVAYLDSATNDLIRRQILSAGFAGEIIVSDDRDEQRQRIISYKPDLIIVGIKKGGVDIIRFCQRKSPQTNIFVYSGSVNAQNLAMIFCVNAFLAKPAGGREITEVVRRLL
ncbi:MAG: hypothetical protein US30_C0002G0009 [Candidatus Moranbacteria bacterium GW2011_GWF2_36_839]|nr:MAG: hypothetical protein US27_C0003G0009 [Candidatus Moranbacteria bacterium GW2011_GWF1_36_78]KKQ17549.1 MAG: hypothetical protein US30_C0002G0009 [Candidatus Moranbacteria bacterium GW2011_GWF2_36_839]HAT74274.1 hypothetical protein [Candidatus Moranbacteria bacterium]HBY10947.1 hypothetical protein [Candidatus Moranbacteria bacterium]